MKKITFLTILLAMFILNFCASKHEILKSSVVKTPSLKKYKNVHFSWLQIDENLWEKYRYSSKKVFVDYLAAMNKEQLKWVKDYLPGKNVTKASYPTDVSKGSGLYIQFKNTKLGPNFEDGTDYLYVTCHYVDTASGKELFYKRVKIIADGWGIEGSFSQANYYLAQYFEKELNK